MRVSKSAKSANVLIIGGNPLERDSLSRLVCDAGHTVFAEDEEVTAEIAIIVLMETHGDVPGDVRSRIISSYSGIPVVLFAENEGRASDLKTAGLNVSAIVDQALCLERISQVLQLVLDGFYVLPASFVEQMPERPAPKKKLPDFSNLLDDTMPSKREMEVAALIAFGKTNKEIAKKLEIAVNTVNVHVNALMRKLNVENRTKIAVWYLTVGQSATTGVELQLSS